MHQSIRSLTAACAVLSVACSAAPAPRAGATGPLRPGWPTELVIAMGVDPESNDELRMRADPIVERIGQATGITLKFFRGTSFSSIVEAMRAGRADGMQVGVFSYLLAEKEAGAEAIAVYTNTLADPPVYDQRLRPDYNGVIVVKKGSGIRALSDLKGRSFNFGDPAGTSDHLVPKTEMLKAGVNPDKEMRTRFAGSHAAALLSLWHGSADGAATSDNALRRLAISGQVEICWFPDSEFTRPHTQAEVLAIYDACPDGRLAVIHSAPIPGTPFALRASLPADLKATIKQALLSTPEDPEFIRQTRRWYTDPSVELQLPNLFAYYDGMRETARLLNLDLTRFK